MGKKWLPGSWASARVTRGRLALLCRHRPSPAFSKEHLLTLVGQKLWRRPRQPLDTRSPSTAPHQRPQLCSAVYILHWCCKALLAYLFFFLFNRRLSLDSRSHDQLFLPHFSLFYALLSVDACFIFLLLVFSFLKLAFWSCFANNRHAFVLFFSFERRRRG